MKYSLLQNKNLLTSLALLISVGVSYLWMRSYFGAILDGWDKYIVMCVDFGQYLNDALRYSKEGIYLLETIEVSKEPGFFLTTSTLTRIAGINPGISIVIVEWLSHILSGLGIFIFIRNNSNKNAYLYGLIGLFFYSFSYLGTHLFFFLGGRQNCSNLFLLLFCLYAEPGKKIQTYIVPSILLAFSGICHRFGFILGIGGLGLYMIYSLLLRDFKASWQVGKIILLTIVMASPYLFINIGDIDESIRWYFLGENTGLEGTTYFMMNETPISLGWSGFTASGTISHRPIIEYLIYQGIILLPFLAFIKNNFQKYKNKKVFWILLFILLYTTTYLIFAVRVLISLEIFLIIFLITYLQNYKNKYVKITAFVLIGILLIRGDTGKLFGNRVQNIEHDSGIEFLYKNVDNKNSVLVGDYCVMELSPQIGYISGHDITSLPLWKRSEAEAQGRMPYPNVVEIFRILIDSLSIEPYAHNILRDKDIYLVYLKGENDIASLDLGKHNNLNSPFLDLVFKTEDKQAYIRYIFKLKREYIKYFDSLDYAQKNLKNLTVPN